MLATYPRPGFHKRQAKNHRRSYELAVACYAVQRKHADRRHRLRSGSASGRIDRCDLELIQSCSERCNLLHERSSRNTCGVSPRRSLEVQNSDLFSRHLTPFVFSPLNAGARNLFLSCRGSCGANEGYLRWTSGHALTFNTLRGHMLYFRTD